MTGRILAGRYRIESEIGEGGMSRVWRATDLNTGKAVAVKVLRDEFQGDETFVRRFVREAQAASRMTHPNIANLLDVGLEEDGTRYLVIEYVSGKTLKQFIKENGALRSETAAQIILRVLAAVQHAHQNGVIHRDIKPQNILIDREGTVKVSDFGIARVANSQTMSQDTDTVMGSVYYFSPEQAKGAEVDEKSDLYSVGVVLYEMLTGRVPFTGDTPVAIAMKHLQDKPTPPSEINPAVSPALDFVVGHAMEKRPRHRYASAADMQRDVRLAMEHPDTILAARAEAERREKELLDEQRKKENAQRRVLRTRRVLVGTLSVVLLAIIALAGYVLMERVLIARRNNVEVPDLFGMQRAEAIRALVDLGLEFEVNESYYDQVPENVVYEQSIAPGTIVARGTNVILEICRTKHAFTIPYVMNMPYEDAQNILSNLGIVISNRENVVSRAEYNMVIDQSLAPGTPANPGDTIELTVSAGSISMPYLLGNTQTQAEQTIQALGLTYNGPREVPVDDPLQVGRVITQEPEPYRQIERNATVTIEIGVASSTLYSVNLMLDLSQVTGTTTVTIYVDENGSHERRYTGTFEGGESAVPITLMNQSPGEATIFVYFNDQLELTDRVVFTR